MKVVIITGLSGAGKTKATDWFEDQGYYCIDNMPPQLVRNFLDLLVAGQSSIEKVALVVDVRGGVFFDALEKCIDDLRQSEDIESRLLFIEASNDTIVKRYNETRRNHPLSGAQVNEKVIEDEKALLSGMRKKADYIIDTTGTKGAGLEHELSRIFLGEESKSAFNVNITSFGYKYGIPSESDIVLDMRFIPNPFYVESLRELTGNNKKIKNYVMKSELAQEFIEDVCGMMEKLAPGYISEGKYHLNLACGCTGGHHRSVAMANELAERFKASGMRVTVTHRDVDR